MRWKPKQQADRQPPRNGSDFHHGTVSLKDLPRRREERKEIAKITLSFFAFPSRSSRLRGAFELINYRPDALPDGLGASLAWRSPKAY
jgi:hypothetical protein